VVIWVASSAAWRDGATENYDARLDFGEWLGPEKGRTKRWVTTTQLLSE